MIRFLMWFCRVTGRVQRITGREPGSDTYMVRHVVFRTKWLSLYIHKFLRSDYDSYHDHPFSFISWIVRGTYVEHLLMADLIPELWGKPVGKREVATVRNTSQNRFMARKAEHLHYITLARNYTEDDSAAPITVCLIGRRRRPWGFLDANDRWVYWKDFLGIPHDGISMEPTDA